MNASNFVYLFSILCLAVMVGIFFSWTISVTPGLGKLNDRSYLQAMQSLNREILNPTFFVVFIGSIVLLPINAFLQYKSGINYRNLLFIGGVIIYLLGTIAVTFLINIPLNNKLDVLDLNSMDATRISEFRIAYEGKWNSYNLVRSISSTIALVLTILPIFLNTGHQE